MSLYCNNCQKALSNIEIAHYRCDTCKSGEEVCYLDDPWVSSLEPRIDILDAIEYVIDCMEFPDSLEILRDFRKKFPEFDLTISRLEEYLEVLEAEERVDRTSFREYDLFSTVEFENEVEHVYCPRSSN